MIRDFGTFRHAFRDIKIFTKTLFIEKSNISTTHHVSNIIEIKLPAR